MIYTPELTMTIASHVQRRRARDMREWWTRRRRWRVAIRRGTRKPVSEEIVSKLGDGIRDRSATHLCVETEHAEDCRRRYFDIDSICSSTKGQLDSAIQPRGWRLTSMVPQLQVSDFVDEQSLKGGVEERPSFEPAKPRRKLVPIDEQSSEKETTDRVFINHQSPESRTYSPRKKRRTWTTWPDFQQDSRLQRSWSRYWEEERHSRLKGWRVQVLR